MELSADWSDSNSSNSNNLPDLHMRRTSAPETMARSTSDLALPYSTLSSGSLTEELIQPRAPVQPQTPSSCKSSPFASRAGKPGQVLEAGEGSSNPHQQPCHRRSHTQSSVSQSGVLARVSPTATFLFKNFIYQSFAVRSTRCSLSGGGGGRERYPNLGHTLTGMIHQKWEKPWWMC